MPDNNQSSESSVNLLTACGVAFIVLLIVIGYIGISQALGIQDYWFGLVFLWFLGSHDHLKLTDIRNAAAGGSVGIATAYFMAFVGQTSTFGLVAIVVIITVLIALLISNRIPLLVNNGTMLMLTVFTFGDVANVPRIQTGAIGFLAGVVFWGGFFTLITFLANRNSQSALTER